MEAVDHARPQEAGNKDAPRQGTLVAVEPAPHLAGIGRALPTRVRALIVALNFLGLLFSIVLFFASHYTFWVLLEALVQLTGLPHGKGILLAFVTTRGWPNDLAVALALPTSLAGQYLVQDWAALRGNRTAQRILREKAERLLPLSGPPRSFFVEVRGSSSRHLRLNEDIGWLFFYPDRLEFVGNRFRATFPRDQVRGIPRLDQNIGRLAAAWMTLDLTPPWGRLRLLVRGDAERLSDTDSYARELQSAFAAWYAGH